MARSDGNWESYLAENRPRFLDELLELVRIPSVSSLPEHAVDVGRAARWVAERLGAAGLEEVELLPTGGHPVVRATWHHAPGQPTVLLYGHFDVQPVDPVELWTSPPFEPTIREGRLYARGASDMKGNLLTTIAAVEALLKTTGRLPVNVTFFLEGQEEIGSPQIPAFLAEQRDRFACDLAVSADGVQESTAFPVLPIGARGLCSLQIDVRGATSDLHSGVYGGGVANPIHALVQILASMRDAEGRVRVAGFYDDVVPLSDADRATINAVPFDEATLKRQLGVAELFGEAGYTTSERIGGRPTLEVNGMWGGFIGEGSKTVLPGAAHAKVTCRLVPNQEPETIVERIAAHVAHHTPHGVTAKVTARAGRARPYLVAGDHPGNQAAAAVLTELYGRAPYYQRFGATVPVLDLFQRELHVATVTVGFSGADEKFHAPDEFYRLASFERGQRAYALLLERLGNQPDLVQAR